MAAIDHHLEYLSRYSSLHARRSVLVLGADGNLHVVAHGVGSRERSSLPGSVKEIWYFLSGTSSNEERKTYVSTTGAEPAHTRSAVRKNRDAIA